MVNMSTAKAMLLVALACANHVQAWIALSNVVEDKDHPGQCWDDFSRVYYPSGTSWKLDQYCGEASCFRGDKKGEMIISYAGCGKVDGPSECHLEENPKAKYPACCPQVVCPESSVDYLYVKDFPDTVAANEIFSTTDNLLPSYDELDNDGNWANVRQAEPNLPSAVVMPDKAPVVGSPLLHLLLP